MSLNMNDPLMNAVVLKATHLVSNSYNAKDRQIINRFGYNYLYKYKVLEYYGFRCSRCGLNGDDNFYFLGLHHINNDGNEYRKRGEYNAGSALYNHIYLKYLKYNNNPPADLKIVCHNCNWIYKIEYESTLKHSDNYKYEHSYKMNQKIQCLKHYAYNDLKCICCGYNDIRSLTIDHISNIHSGLKGNYLWRYLILNNFPEGYQVLCMNCNQGKHDNKNCPHKTVRKGL